MNSYPSSPVAEYVTAAPRVAADLDCRPAATDEDLTMHFAVRHEVFVAEQAIFAGSDRDDRDDDPGAIHVVGLCGGAVRGAVRLYPLDREAGLWKGDRLAVLPGYRHLGLGAPLVRFAVHAAGRRGGREMIAYVQPGNVTFFEKLGWLRSGEPTSYVGRPHQRMIIRLTDAAAPEGTSPGPR